MDKTDAYRFVNGISTKDEINAVRDFYRGKPAPHLIVKVSGDILQKEGDLSGIATDLAVLHALGIMPMVIYGWGTEGTNRLKAAGFSSAYDAENDRLTSKPALDQIIVPLAVEFGERMAFAVGKATGNAILLPQGASLIAEPKYVVGHPGEATGRITSVSLDGIVDACDRGLIPILSPIGSSSDGRGLLNTNGDSAGASFVGSTTLKVLMVGKDNGILHPQNGTKIDEIDINDYQNGTLTLRDRRFQPAGEVSYAQGKIKKLDEIKGIFDKLASIGNNDATVQVVSPYSLLAEIFTRKGRGTYVRKGHEVITLPLSSVSPAIFAEVFSASFPHERYDEGHYARLQDFQAQGHGVTVFLEKERKGMAVLLYVKGLGNHLDLIGVKREYAGNGVSKDLFKEMFAYVGDGTLFWQTRPDREANGLYVQLKDAFIPFIGQGGKPMNGFFANPSSGNFTPLIDFMQYKEKNLLAKN